MIKIQKCFKYKPITKIHAYESLSCIIYLKHPCTDTLRIDYAYEMKLTPRPTNHLTVKNINTNTAPESHSEEEPHEIGDSHEKLNPKKSKHKQTYVQKNNNKIETKISIVVDKDPRDNSENKEEEKQMEVKQSKNTINHISVQRFFFIVTLKYAKI